MTTAPASKWATGVARVVMGDRTGRHVRVQCPFGDHIHQHSAQFVGSLSVLAGCHTGWNRCREYSIPDPRRNRR